MNLTERLVARRRSRIARELLLLYGIEFPAEVEVGEQFRMVHRGLGTVIHPRTRIGDRVRIFHQVTIGRGDGHLPAADSKMEYIEIGDDAVLFPGAKVLGGDGVTRIGQGTIVAANAVITKSTGDWEVWGGVPARKIADRPRN
ncbi:serine O-acetyltransferase [Microbacterium luteum]|uniref:serine O-acetyltransferase n=1 Tax=Microbacterium luteum TaxID=2782167 RepID=UPI0018890E01|nr:serine acetyltransferase [Microbacterium luteum]